MISGNVGRFRSLADVGVFLLAVVVGCAAGPEDPATPRAGLTSDERYGLIAERVPGFGGLFVDQNGDLTAYLRDASDGVSSLGQAFAALDHVPGDDHYFVSYQPGAKAGAKAAVQAGQGAVLFEFDDLSTLAVSLPAAAVDALQRNSSVTRVEVDPERSLMGQVVPYGVDSVQARDIWDANRDGVIDPGAPIGAGRLVCIIDSGLYTTHEDHLGVSVVGGYSQVGGRWQTDGCGHGTHVAGTIAAAHNNLGVVGVNPGTVSLYIIKIFTDDCSWKTRASNLIDAANRCAAAGANVINMSLGGGSPSATEEQAFQNLYNQGVLSVAASGNEGCDDGDCYNNDAYSYPASYPSVVSVAATDSANNVADLSTKNSAVELAAPGVAVQSTIPWLETNTVTVDGVTYDANHIENTARGTASGALANGGLCDSAGSWRGKVVLCQRGTISFAQKLTNVQRGGGVAGVIYNNVPGGFLSTVGNQNGIHIPALSLSQEDGQYLVASKLGSSAAVVSSFVKPASGYEAWAGTSMATPHVSGGAALVWSANPSWTNAQVRQALQNTALDLGSPAKDNSYGYGLIQLKSALNALAAQ